jgi:hypothetical protein
MNMISFLQINDTEHIGIQGISSINIDLNVMWHPELAPAVGSRPDIVVIETYGGVHNVPDDGHGMYYELILKFMRTTYLWSKYSPHAEDLIVNGLQR